MDRTYLDHNATSPMRPQVRELFLETLEAVRGNPSSLHASGRAARAVVDLARERVAAALGVREDEVLFTSGATEANNLALFGATPPSGGVVTSSIEHASVLEPLERLADEGHRVTRIGVDGEGRVDLEGLLAEARAEGCSLVSLQTANGEVGSVAPVEAVAATLGDLPPGRRPRLHTDAVQALGRVPLALGGSGVDLASFSAHKVGGPVGCGVLFCRTGVPLRPQMMGGGQELARRSGTENVAAIAATALAFEIAVAERAAYAEAVGALTRRLWTELRGALPTACLLGPPLDAAPRLPNTLCVSIPGCDGRVLVTRLDLAGLEVSAGSACASGSIEPSHVLLAMGLPAERARSGLRLSVGWNTTHADVVRAVEILRITLSDARKS